jgi:uncharacterized protein DUF6603
VSAKSLLQDLLSELADLHESAAEMLSDDIIRNEIVRDLGGTPGTAAPQFPPAGLQSVKAYRDASEPGLEALLEALQDFRRFHESLQAFGAALNLGADTAAEEGYRALMDIFGWNLIRLRHPFLYFILQVASFVEDTVSPFEGQYGKVPLPAAFNRLAASFMDGIGYLKRSHFNSEHGVQRFSDVIALSSFAGVKATRLKKITGDVIYGFDQVPGLQLSDPQTPAADRTQNRVLSLNFPKCTGSSFQDLVASMAWVPRTQGGPGLFLSLGGGLQVSEQLSTKWRFRSELHCAGAVSVIIGGDRKLQFHGPDENSDFRGVVSLEARPDPLDATAKAFNLAIATNTGLSAELVHLEGSLTQKAAQFRMSMLGAVATLSPDSFDNFIAKILPKDGLRVDFDLGVGVASDRGAFYEGTIRSAGTGGTQRPTTPPPPGVQPPPLPPLPPETGPGFGLTIPIGKSLGPFTIHNLQLRFGSEDVDGKSTYLLQAASSISTKIGPVMARVDRAGLKFGVRFPDKDKGETGNLGIADVDVGAVLPNGVSLAIDVKGYVTGGGFLYHDKVQQVYAGVFELSIKERITVKAFGLIATKMPDGSKGYSLIVFITAEGFQPIPIGMAAMLRGIGGMVAINRTFDEEAMRAGLRNKTLGTLLFPKDPVRNAPEIIRNLITTFPAEEGAYLAGLLMKITWFQPTLVYLDIAIMIELGKRMRVIVLGMISALLPTKENDLVRLNMDALGLINMGQLSVAVDAVIIDSRLAQKFVLTGEMALRASMAPGRRNFVMAVGGFNPRFAPPENFPTLKRITIALASGNNPRLTCEAYFAITSNTIQFGARAELYAAAFGFSIEGDVGFDVLIHLLPFHLIADFKASVQLKRGSRNLFKLSVAGTLEGPRPLRISGKASFEIFWCDFTIRFDKTLISGEKPPLPPAVDVFAELRRALTVPDAWSTQLAASRQHGVSLRKIAPGTTLVLDPLGNLVVKQQTVPLNTSRDLDTFGGAPIAGARSFKLQASIEGVTQDVNNVQDAFAPGQFFDMTDDEKLASPSFEDMDAGAIFGSDAIVIDEGASIFAPLEFETIIIDEQGQATNEVEDRYVLVAHRFFEQVRFSAVGTAPIRRIGTARFRNLDLPPAVAMRSGQFVIATVADGIAPPTAKPATFVEAQATLRRLNRGVSGEALWQVLPVHETVR